MIKINASDLNFEELNDAVRSANDDVEISDCLGQRFIGAGLSDKTTENFEKLSRKNCRVTCLDGNSYYKRCVFDGGWCIHPLPLLTVIGNGYATLG